MEPTYLSFSSCCRVVLNNVALPLLPCCHFHPCEERRDVVFLFDSLQTTLTFDPTLPIRVGSLPLRSNYHDGNLWRPVVVTTPGFSVDVVVRFQGRRSFFRQFIPSLDQAQGYFHTLAGTRVVEPGPYTITMERGLFQILPSSGYARETKKIVLAQGVSTLFGLVVEPDTQYNINCQEPVLPFPYTPVNAEVWKGDRFFPSAISYADCLIIANSVVCP